MYTHVVATLTGAAAAGIVAYLHLRRSSRRSSSAAPTNPGTFVLERFFAEFEFNAKHQICNSDVSALSMKELLALCAEDVASTRAWDDLSLGYTESRGAPALLAEIASCYGPSISAEDVLECVPAEGILLSAQALVQQGDEIVVQWPAYQSLFEIARSRGARVRKWTARGGGAARLYFDVDDLAALCGVAAGEPKPIRAFVINFPHNPTGAHLTAAEQVRIVSIARACGAFVLSDEMYRGLEHTASHPTLPAMCDVYEKGISLAGMSKVFALPGLRVGWLVSPLANGFIEECSRLKDYTTICGSAPSEALALMALRQRDALLARSRRIIADGLAAVDAFFGRQPQLAHYHPPMAGPICYPCFKGDGLSAADVMAYARGLVGAKGVLILPGGACYEVDDAQGTAHFRLGLGRVDIADSLHVYEQALTDPRFTTCRKVA
mmetsp:Transcript_37646/g.88043  ORF Transcript_37646/g.88043 Transcript_37646/m.88043 type:complete len:437 (-) Transcript_37646:253-1563(-)